MNDLQQLQKNSWQTSEEHGFHHAMLNLPPQTLATYLKLFLTIGELCEAGEELRAGRDPFEIYYTHKDGEYQEISLFQWSAFWRDEKGPHRSFFHKPPTHQWLNERDAKLLMGKPEGFPIELADALIRLCDLAEDVGVDLSEASDLKAAYNRTREFMHGKTA